MTPTEFRERQLAHVERLNVLVTQILANAGAEVPVDSTDVEPEEAAAAFLMASMAVMIGAGLVPAAQLWPTMAASNIQNFELALEGARLGEQ